MITFITKFPINDKFGRKEFLEQIIYWNQGSKYNKIENLDWDGESYECRWEQDGIVLETQEIPSESIIGARLTKEDESGVWFTDFVLNYSERYLAVSVALETTEFTTEFRPTYYPPFFVKAVIYRGYAGFDLGLEVTQSEHYIDECKDIIKDVFTRKIKLKMPVVYVAKTKGGQYPVDANELAFRLQGVAHVICESDEKIDIEVLPQEITSEEMMLGKIFIFYPSSNKKAGILNMTGGLDDPEGLADRITRAVYNYMNQRMRKACDTWDGITTEKLHIINRELLSDQTAAAEENKQLYDVFGEQLEQMEQANIKLNNDIQRLTAELQGLRMKYSDKDNIPIIREGEEKDFYEGEIREIILEILEDYRRNCKDDSRRSHIIADILQSNEYNHIPEKRREQLKSALKGYRSLNGSLKGLLETLGFEISSDGKHYKWTYFGDHRYVTTVAKTNSDGRAGMNISSTIDKLMF